MATRNRKNLLKTEKGWLWTDFEDACGGPTAWDVACLVRTAPEGIEAALASYPGAPTWDELLPYLRARELEAVVYWQLQAAALPRAEGGSPGAAARMAAAAAAFRSVWAVADLPTRYRFSPVSSGFVRSLAYALGMMRMTVLASGSKGNSTVVATQRTRILVDAGLSCREILKRMQTAGEDPRSLDAILITHEHQDHVQGVAVLARKLGIPVYFTEMTHRAWVRWMRPRKRMTYADWLRQRQQGAADATAKTSARSRSLRLTSARRAGC